MKVNIEFDRPFNGLVFSKGHYRLAHAVVLPLPLPIVLIFNLFSRSDPKCVHLSPGECVVKNLLSV